MSGDYHIDVKDFGPIAQASVDLRPLTVFIGPSNTGKSYLAVLLYALHQCLHRFDDTAGGWRLSKSLPFDLSAAAFTQAGSSLRTSLTDWGSRLSRKGTPGAVPAEVSAAIRTILQEPTDLSNTFKLEVRRCFGVDHLVELVRRHGAVNRVSLGLSTKTGNPDGPRYELAFGRGQPRISGRLPDLRPLFAKPEHRNDLSRVAMLLHDLDGDSDSSRQLHVRSLTLLDSILRSVFEPLCRNAYYLPADRTGVMHSHHAVVGPSCRVLRQWD